MLLTTAPPTVRLEAFEGPIDLLLHLVRAGKMDIFDLPIALLCDQYIGYLNAMEALDLAVAGEFLVMAATLLEIKSRMLLPAPPRTSADEAEDLMERDPRAELVQRLLEYGRFQSVAETLMRHEGQRRQVFFRPPVEFPGDYRLPPNYGEISADELLRALERILAEVGAGERAVTSVRRQKITLRMKMREVLTHAESAGAEGIDLTALLPEPPFLLIEVVLLFLALLELLKSGSILVAQEAFCGDIRLFFVPEDQRDVLIGEEVTEGLDGDERDG